MNGLIFDLQRFADYTLTYDENAAEGKKYILTNENAETTDCATPQEAFNKLADGDKVTLQSDIDAFDKSVTVQKTVTLDLNGHSWTRTEAQATATTGRYSGGNAFTLQSGGHLIVEDNTSEPGEIAVAKAVTDKLNTTNFKTLSYVIQFSGNGKFTLNGGRIVNYGENPTDKVSVYGIGGSSLTKDSFITINGGSVLIPNDTGENGKALVVTSGTATVTVNKGAYISSTGYGLDLRINLVINGGTIESKLAAVNLNNTGTVVATINGGTIKSATGDALNFGAAKGTLNISGGEFDGKVAANSEAKVYVDGGSFTEADITAIFKIDGTEYKYTLDEWAKEKDNYTAVTVDGATQYFTTEKWDSIQSNIVTPALSKDENRKPVLTYTNGETFVEGTNYIKATFNGKEQYFTTEEACKEMLSGCNGEYLDGKIQWYQSDKLGELKPSISVRIDNITNYFTSEEILAEYTKGFYKVYVDGNLRYYTNKDKLAQDVTPYGQFNATIDNEIRYYTDDEKFTEALTGKASVEIDGTKKYYTDATEAESVKNNAVTAIVDGAEKLFTNEDTLAAMNYKSLEIDGTTKYYTTDELLQAARDSAIKVFVDGEEKLFSTQDDLTAMNYIAISIDGEAKYYTTDELATAARTEATDNNVAKIGDDKYYSTLVKAVAAVGNKEIITVLKDETGAGIKTGGSDKNFTIDFNGHTYTVGNPAVGSAGTESQAFHLGEGATVTLKNGKITSSATTSDVAMLVQNYCNLTLEDMTLDGSNLADAYYGSIKPENLGACVTLSLNNGTIKILGNTNIIARNDENREHYAMDVYASNGYPDGAHVTINTTGTIGNILIDGKKTGNDGKFVSELIITGGTIGKIRLDTDAIAVNAQDKIKITGGTTFNGNLVDAKTYLVLKDKALFEVFADEYILGVEGWNKTADKTFVYVTAPESGNIATEFLTVSGIDSTDNIKIDDTQKIIAVPSTAAAILADKTYSLVKVTYDDTAATVNATVDGIKITDTLLAETVTKISAADNANTIYISGGNKVTSIVGGSKDDTLSGTNSDLTMTGGKGDDLFVYDSGKLTITDYGDGSDKISLKSNATAPTVSSSGENVLLNFGDGNEINLTSATDKIVTLTNGKNDSYYSKDGEISADGESITLSTATTSYTATDKIKSIDGTKTSGVTVTGNELANTITGGNGDNKFTGGKGDDLFVYDSGKLTITDYGDGSDKISVKSDATAPTVSSSGENVLLNFGDGNEINLTSAASKIVTLTNKNGDSYYSKDGEISADGESITLSTATTSYTATSKIKFVDGTKTKGVTVTGNDLANTITGGNGDNKFTGGKGDDLFVYDSGKLTITDYGDGSDKISVKSDATAPTVSSSSENVLLNFGDGNEINLTGATDKIVTLTSGKNDSYYSKDGEISADGESITLSTATTSYTATDKIKFVDGTKTKGVIVTGNDLANTITGGNGDNKFTGGVGDDLFVYDSGKLTITDYGDGSDKISLKSNATAPTVSSSGENVLLNFGDGNEINLTGATSKIVILTNGKNDSYYSKDGEISADGESITLSTAATSYTATNKIKFVDGTKTSGVTVTGNKLDNTITGGNGDNKFTGGKGDDLFVLSGGNDTITDYGNGSDKISVESAPSSFALSGKNVVFTFDDGKKLTVNGVKGKSVTFTDGKTDTVRTYLDGGIFADNGKITLDKNFKGNGYNISQNNNITQIDASAVDKNLNLVGNNLGNTLIGGTGNDTLTGGTTAKDELTGGAGADIFVYQGGSVTITDYKSTDKDVINLTKNFAIQSASFGGDEVTFFAINVNGNALTLKDSSNDTITVRDASNKVWTYASDFTAQGTGVSLTGSAKKFDASTSDWKNLVTINGSAASTGAELIGNAKNNLFIGSNGSDTFVHTAGNDVITNYNSNDFVKVGNFGDVTATKISGGKTVLTLNKGTITFKNKLSTIKLVDNNGKTATVTTAGVISADEIHLLNGTKKYAGTASTVDASNVKNAITIAGGSKAQTLSGNAGKTVYTYNGTGTMTIANYAAGDKVSIKGSVTAATVDDATKNVTFAIDGGGTIVLENAADKTITLHDNANKSKKYTARAYLETGITADKAKNPTAVTLSGDVSYSAPSTVKQITYTGGEVTVTNFNSSTGKINYGTNTITDVTTDKITFSDGNALTLGNHNSSVKVNLTGKNSKGKSVNSTLWLGDHVLYDNTEANATSATVLSGSTFTAGGKINSVKAATDEKISITGNKLNNTLTANDKGNTLDGGTGSDVLIGGNGADVFIHNKTTGTTTIKNYTSADSISLGDDLSIVGSAYSAGKNSGKLTLTVNDDDGSASKIVITGNEFKKANGTTYGTIALGEDKISYGNNAIYNGSKVELLPTFKGKFSAKSSSEVDGSNVTKNITLQGSKYSDTLIGGDGKDTLTGGKGDDILAGGNGADVFTYSKGDGNDVIADFTCNEDKLKVSSKGIIKDVSLSDGDLKFTMKDGGSVTIDDLEGDFFIKSKNSLYWFDDGELVTASDTTTKNELSAIIKNPTDYAIVQLDYGTGLAGIATKIDATETTFSTSTFKK